MPRSQPDHRPPPRRSRRGRTAYWTASATHSRSAKSPNRTTPSPRPTTANGTAAPIRTKRSPGRNSYSHHPAAAPPATNIRSAAPSPHAITSSSSRFCGTFTGSTSSHRCGHQLGRGDSRLDHRAPAQWVAECPVVGGEGELEQEVEQRDEDKSRGQVGHRPAQPIG